MTLHSCRRLAAGALVALLLAGCASPFHKEAPPVAPPQPIAKRAPRIGLALGGGAARGFAHVAELQKKYGKDGLAIVGIAVSDRLAAVKKFAADQGLNYTVLLDDGSGVPEKFGTIEAIPTTFIIDRDGNLRDRKVGAEETSEYEQTLLQYLQPKKA